MSNGPFYRLGQFGRALGARPHSDERGAALRALTVPQRGLFALMSPRDQWHAWETLRLLREQGAVDEDLTVAALLHDAGKGHVRMHERILYVVLLNAPSLLHWLAARDGRGWRHTLYRCTDHAETGALLALAAGAGERAAYLIRVHHDRASDDAAVRALAHADDRA